MPSTFSPNLRIALIGNGEQAGTWGTTTNTNLGTLIEDAISGYETVSVTSANQAFTTADGAADQARSAMIELTTTTGAVFNVYAPPSPKTYIIVNSSAHTATLYNSTVAGNTTAAGTGVVIPAGARLYAMTDGTDFTAVVPASATAATADTLALRDGSGGVFGATAAPGTNNTQLASTAFVQAVATSIIAGAIPAGIITLWSGSVASVPSGWGLCDGTSGTPDLRSRFVVGAGSTYAVAATGGSADAIVVSHTHTGTTGNQSVDHSHSGTTGAGGSHNHDANSGQAGVGQGAPGPNAIQQSSGSELTSTAPTHTHPFSTGIQSASHNHAFTTGSTGSSGTNANLPPYYALAYIMKL
jgi:hypothetical protein